MLAIVMVLILCVSAAAYEEELVILSELSDEELLSFLEDSGVDIPVRFEPIAMQSLKKSRTG